MWRVTIITGVHIIQKLPNKKMKSKNQEKKYEFHLATMKGYVNVYIASLFLNLPIFFMPKLVSVIYSSLLLSFFVYLIICFKEVEK